MGTGSRWLTVQMWVGTSGTHLMQVHASAVDYFQEFEAADKQHMERGLV